MNKKSSAAAPIVPSDDQPFEPSRSDLLKTKLDLLLSAIWAISTKLDAHITKSSDVIHEISAASTIKFLLYPEAEPLSNIPFP